MLLETDVVVVGGGATGAAVLWDLALRGIDAVLVDRDDLGTGTSGRWHGELHSGGRYAVKDQVSARECVHENRILRHIAPHTIEDAGGWFILLPEHDQAFGDRFVQGCRDTRIPCEEVPPAEARRTEQGLTSRIERAFRLETDGGMDSWKLIWSMAGGAMERGARVLTRHPLIGFERDGDGRITAARVHDLVGGSEELIGCRWVINAAGAWAGQVAAHAGVPLHMVPGKGAMVVMASRYVRSLISHCRMPTDGDIIVPSHEAAILGTTSTEAPDPDDIAIDPVEVDLLIDEAAKLVPAIAGGRVLRAFVGQRPLYKPPSSPGATGSTREISRTFTVLDHAERDGVPNFLSIVGGKLTTCRGMAEKVVDALVARRGTGEPCTTATTQLPGAAHGTHRLAQPLAEVERDGAYGELLCECELVTRGTVHDAIRSGVTELDDLRRQHRFGFGPCQGVFCAVRGAAAVEEERAAGRIPTPDHGAGEPPVADPLDNLRRFLQERWRGQRAVAWGGGAVQALLGNAVYRGIFALHTLDPEPPAPPAVTAPGADRAAADGVAVGGAGGMTGDSDGRAGSAEPAVAPADGRAAGGEGDR
jgi:glycerol-3-phosphate dehydrogenase